MPKKTDVVVHLTEVTPTTTIASARIAKFVKHRLKVDMLVDNDISAEIVADPKMVKDVGTVYLVNGPPAFCTFRDTLAEIVRRCDKLVWIQNDYTIYPPSQVNKVCRERGWVDRKGHIDPPVRWTTIPARMRKLTDWYINWNALTYDPRRVRYDKKINKLFYYGAFREFRVGEFHQYFDMIQYRLVISGSGRAEKRFREHWPIAEYVPPCDDIIAECTKYRYGLYIHDKSSVKTFCSMANRFYEMLSAKMCILVADNAVDTFEQAGYHVPSAFVVEDGYEIKKRFRWPKNIWRRHLDWQQRKWGAQAKKDHDELNKQLHEASRGRK